ncbi:MULTISPECIES: bleomycin resistance protein [Alteromonas]|jgi:uncharacterized glyoxalase superfamily protein PhnB|uniref:Glyoxalase/fosfomycin resistance/dioxygenase domain-containing protein n=1 Tax=Alteromonas mediterranea TaxID=314275 RepID=A0AAC8XPA2_9ALTE|nr:VOC family protein [Alteromonas mediterranea]AGP92061.1 Glyoxalase/bleomycin resistance protein/dioxygenase [Alteromonas mediterranea U8]AFV87765.1 Glyoxalase/bleomycin resistance protein/dioxygenase [Alteromonas mediterranea DE1]AGP87805.1 Glyoxalase/bleomycin resistance protein/dioxygenase [Alteromonas mediterranea U4]AGP88184.1 Glyoxalase/bleomycin resistance protein/dioxygenase [Alteromonas mediterranea U7]AGP99787.1 Glyoxalase/bleomycin resistance protein/dioxygenase [Alteromonas medit|tara:strand:- start:40120 stop:40464 length:345 start_codon:yes stop_codon:yes gene_type:complete
MSDWEPVPVLAALNLQGLVDFYTGKLGFHCDNFVPEKYAIVSRGEAEIHFWACSDKYVADNTSCYIYVTEIQAVFEELQKQTKVSPLREMPWGVLEFHLIDPSGNLLKFGQPVQ